MFSKSVASKPSTTTPSTTTSKSTNQPASTTTARSGASKAVSTPSVQPFSADTFTARASKAQAGSNASAKTSTAAQQVGTTAQTTGSQRAVYPPEVTAVIGDVNTYLNNLQPPANVAAQGTSAVNEWKMQQLSNRLHEEIYQPDGSYRSNPPFNDAQALQTMYSAAAQLSYDSMVAAGKNPDGADREEWNESWASLAGTGIQANSFGDYGFDPIYQDGTPTQSAHFHMALNGSLRVDDALGQVPVIGGALQWIAGNNTVGTFLSQLGNYQHEYQGAGPSKQDAFNSMFAILVARDMKAGTLDPFAASALIGSGLQSGEPIISMDFSNPSNYLWAGPALGLPDAQVDQSRYPN